MSPPPPQLLALPGGALAQLRPARRQDSPRLLGYLRAVAEESPFLSFGPGEHVPTEEVEAAWIEGTRRAGGCVLVAEVEGALVGLLSCRRGERPRLRHRAELGLSVRKPWWGQGIGRGLSEAALRWAKASGITRVSLSVRADNPRAIALYEGLGFEQEGRARRAARVDGAYVDELQMAILLDAASGA